MREHVEANKIEGVDDIDSHYMETGKAQYNEDSDQVSMERPIFSVTLWLLTNVYCLFPLQDLLE